jgi:hypothetical protein
LAIQTSWVEVKTYPDEHLRIVVDGAELTAPQSFDWTVGDTHSIGVVQYQEPTTWFGSGSRWAFASWPDGGAMTHTIEVPHSAATYVAYVAYFDLQCQLTTAISPPGTGTVSPPSGSWYKIETVVPVKAFPSSGYSFVRWDDGVADPREVSTTVTIFPWVSVTANVAGNPVLTPAIKGKSGEQDARKWQIRLSNSGQSTARSAQIDALSLTQTYGSACTPKVTTPLPVNTLGDIEVGDAASGTVTIDFRGCATTARFTATIHCSANGGAVTGTKSYGNQFR